MAEVQMTVAGCRVSIADSSARTRTGARSENGGAGRAGGRAIADPTTRRRAAELGAGLRATGGGRYAGQVVEELLSSES
jgi:hypothetical protein